MNVFWLCAGLFAALGWLYNVFEVYVWLDMYVYVPVSWTSFPLIVNRMNQIFLISHDVKLGTSAYAIFCNVL